MSLTGVPQRVLLHIELSVEPYDGDGDGENDDGRTSNGDDDCQGEAAQYYPQTWNQVCAESDDL